MSIWCSWEHIGFDPWKIQRGVKPRKAPRGQVRSYADGFSNHCPDTTGKYEQPATIALSSIAPWCVDGHDQLGPAPEYACTGCGADHEEGVEVGPWLRLEVLSHEHSWGDGGKPTGNLEGATVVLDEQAVQSLVTDLQEWLSRDHVQALSPVSPAPVTFRAADEHVARPGDSALGRSASTT